MFAFTKTLAMAATKHRRLLAAIAISLTALSNACASYGELPDAPAFYSVMEYQAKEQRKRIGLSPSTDINAPPLSEGIGLTSAFPSDLDEYILNFIRSPHDLSQISLLNRSFCLWASKKILTLYTLAQKSYERYKIDDNSLQSVLRKKSQLRVLSLSECGRLSDESLSKAVPQFCPELVALDLSGCYKLTNAGLDTMISMLPDLIVLNLLGCDNVTGEGLGSLGKAHKALRVLTIPGRKASDITLEQFVIRFPNLNLLDMHIGYAGVITGAGIEALARRVPRLKYLYLGGHKKLGDNWFETIKANFHELRLLDVTACAGKGSGEDLMNALPNLSILVNGTSIKLGSSVTNEDLLYFLHRYSYALEHLNLSSCPLLTEDAVIKVIIRFSKFLGVVKLNYSDQITDKTLEALLSCRPKRGKPTLRSIQIKGCSKITENGLAMFRAVYPEVEICI